MEPPNYELCRDWNSTISWITPTCIDNSSLRKGRHSNELFRTWSNRWNRRMTNWTGSNIYFIKYLCVRGATLYKPHLPTNVRWRSLYKHFKRIFRMLIFHIHMWADSSTYIIYQEINLSLINNNGFFVIQRNQLANFW